MAARARPVPAPEMNAHDDEPANGSADPPPTLNRRRPQTHLAPELRGPARERAPEPDHPVPAPRAPTATDALSQYQASRHAARADAERRDAEEHHGADADTHADAEQEAPR